MSVPKIKIYRSDYNNYAEVDVDNKTYTFKGYKTKNNNEEWRAALHAANFVKENFENIDDKFEVELISAFTPDYEDDNDFDDYNDDNDFDDYVESDEDTYETDIITLADIFKENSYQYKNEPVVNDYSTNYYSCYQSLGGKMTYNEYNKHLKVFLLLVVDSFVTGGERSNMNREEAIDAFTGYAKGNSFVKEVKLFFDSVDLVHSLS